MLKKTLKFIRGDDISFTCELKDSVGNKLNLQGSRFDLHARNQQDILVINLSSTDNSIEIGEGVLSLHFSNASTQNLPIGEYSYDLQMIDSQNKRKTILGGKISLIKDYTRI